MLKCASLVITILTASATMAQTLPEPVSRIIDGLATTCSATDNGMLNIHPGAITPQPLLGYNAMGLSTGWVIDEHRISCTSLGARANCGTGGCPVHFVIGDVVTTKLAKAWRLTEMRGQTIVLLERHGGACSQAGAAVCYEALTFDETGTGISVSAP